MEDGVGTKPTRGVPTCECGGRAAVCVLPRPWVVWRAVRLDVWRVCRERAIGCHGAALAGDEDIRYRPKQADTFHGAYTSKGPRQPAAACVTATAGVRPTNDVCCRAPGRHALTAATSPPLTRSPQVAPRLPKLGGCCLQARRGQCGPASKCRHERRVTTRVAQIAGSYGQGHHANQTAAVAFESGT